MLRSLLTTAVRRLVRHRGFVAINVVGLALGLAATFMLGLFVEYELSYDDFHRNAGDIYRLVERPAEGEGGSVGSRTRMPAAPTLVREMPEVKAGTRVRQFDTPWFGGPNSRLEVTPTYVDSTFFDVFSFEVVRGDGKAAVSTPGGVALTQSMAQKLFGDTDPVGKTIDVNFGEDTYRVRAVVADPPGNSTVQFDLLVARQTVAESLSRYGGWYNTNTTAYVRLQPNASLDALRARLPAFSERHFAEHEGGLDVLGLRPLTQEHAVATNSQTLIALLAALALTILGIAGINFMNLMTARGLDRVAEVGMRRALGARRREVAGQFLFESVAICVLAFVGAVGLVVLALPSFNTLLELKLSIDWLRHGAMMGGVAVGLGLLVGLYPAFYLTRVETSEALQGRFAHSTAGQRLRAGLVVMQFALSVALIAGTIGVWQQVEHMKGQDPGVAQENIAVMEISTDPFGSTGVADTRLRSMRNRLLQAPGVQQVTFSEAVPTEYDANFNTYVPGGGGGEGIRLRQTSVDHDYFATYGIDLVAGRPFQPRTTEQPVLWDAGAVVNAAAAERIRALTGDSTVVGTALVAGGGGRTVRVRGVTASFRHQSAAQVTDPVIHYYNGDHPGRYQYLSVRMAPGAASGVMEKVETEWARVYPQIPFDYFFVDDAFDRLYRTQERIGTLAGIAAALAALIACLGLFSLAAFNIHQRTREISIRKVLGATVPSIVGLLSKDFLKLVGLAFVLAAPPTYIALDRWLQDFATRIDLGPTLFLATGAGIALLALLTVGVQATRAALTDPAETLRREQA
jgi:putative ABC transport system permease protein